MKHYLKKLEDTIREHWDQKALCDYEGESFTYADLAKHIEMFRLFLNESGITKPLGRLPPQQCVGPDEPFG